MTKTVTKKPRRRVGLFLAAAIALAVIVALVIIRRPDVDEAEAPPGKLPVELVDVGLMTLDETVRGIGTLQATASVRVQPEIAGRLRSIEFVEGREVEAGQVLFQLDDDKLNSQLRARQAALRAAEVRADNAERSFGRQEDLAQQGVVAEDEYDQAQAELDSALAEMERAEAEVALIQEQLQDATIRAPFGGVISERQVDPGAYIGVGDVLASLYQLDPLEISFSVPERFAGRVRRGQDVSVSVAAFPGQTFEGELDFVSPAVDEATRTLQVKAVVPNEEMRLSPGGFATAVVTVDRHEDQPVVPEEALVATREGYLVFIVENGMAESRQVRTGLRHEGMVEVRDGLAAGDRVVRSGHLRLSDGDPVSVVDAQTEEEQVAQRDLREDEPASQ